MNKHERRRRIASLPTFVMPGEVASPIDMKFLINRYGELMNHFKGAGFRHVTLLALAGFICASHSRITRRPLAETMLIVTETAEDMWKEFHV
jgi:hypothetical protein